MTYDKALGLLLFKWNFVFRKRVFMGMAVSDWERVSLLTFSDVLRFKWYGIATIQPLISKTPLLRHKVVLFQNQLGTIHVLFFLVISMLQLFAEL